MKKIMILVLSFLFAGLLNATSALPGTATINFVLSKVEEGSCPAILKNAPVRIDYDYDFKRNMGLAYLKQLQMTKWTEVLHPLGISGVYAFMSDMAPKVIHLNGGDVVVYRIIFNLELNGDSQATMMIGEQGDCIMTSNVVNVNK